MWANSHGPSDVRLSWGGARDSGFGREHGDEVAGVFCAPEKPGARPDPLRLAAEAAAIRPKAHHLLANAAATASHPVIG